jgi:TRAP-type C4-dicarboxylate transport system substrate-binding protein
MWSGFNLLANLKYWRALPDDIQDVIRRNAAKYVAMQRAYTDDLNRSLVQKLAERGMIFNEADGHSFRTRLGDFYGRWKREFGPTAWSLLEEQVGRLG